MTRKTDEQDARLHLERIGVKLTNPALPTLSNGPALSGIKNAAEVHSQEPDQEGLGDYLVVPVEGQCKPHYRY